MGAVGGEVRADIVGRALHPRRSGFFLRRRVQIYRRFEYGGHHVTLLRDDDRCGPEQAAAHCWFASLDGSDALHAIPVSDCDDVREAVRRIEAWIDRLPRRRP